MKNVNPLALIIATSALFITTTPLVASDTDDRIEASARNSYVFKTYLKDDSIKAESKDGGVTLNGTDVEGVIDVINQMTVPQALSQTHMRPSALQNVMIANN